MRAFIGLGSNLGDREANVRQALEHLAHAPETSVVRASSLYDTEPVGAEEQPHFLLVEVAGLLGVERQHAERLGIAHQRNRRQRADATRGRFAFQQFTAIPLHVL